MYLYDAMLTYLCLDGSVFYDVVSGFSNAPATATSDLSHLYLSVFVQFGL